MNTKLYLGAIMTAIILGGSALANTKPKSEITLERAQEIALKRIDGTIEQAGMVKRHGKERYSIFVQESNGLTAHEFINAKTGKILWVKDETPATAKIK